MTDIGWPDSYDDGYIDAEQWDDPLAAIAAAYAPVDWAKAWDAQPEEVRWLIEPVLEAGTVNALFAKVDTGKSLLALEWALLLARAGRTVVYVDEENRLTDVVDRLKAFGACPGELEGLRFYSYAGLPVLDGQAGGTHLLAVAQTAGADLVVLDTTTRMVAGRENDADTFLQLYRHSLVPLKKRGITVLRLDHPGKDEERGQRGSSAKDGDCDTIWRLTEVVKGRKYRLRRTKNRSGHAPEAGDLEVERLSGPLRHQRMTHVGGAVSELERLGVPASAGRVRAGAALREAGFTARTDVLEQAVRIRKLGLPLPFADWGVWGQSGGTAALPQKHPHPKGGVFGAGAATQEPLPGAGPEEST
jgi:hypothetical protein